MPDFGEQHVCDMVSNAGHARRIAGSVASLPLESGTSLPNPICVTIRGAITPLAAGHCPITTNGIPPTADWTCAASLHGQLAG
jgi:hypothetical protein